jgi:hypothetical protein
MPWKRCHVRDERLRFVARLLEGEQDAGVGSASEGMQVVEPCGRRAT